MKATYTEGTWFAIPLRTSGYAVGLVARANRASGAILVYLFGPRRETLPSLSETEGLVAADALKVLRTGDLNLINGSWPPLGPSKGWNRSSWPMPKFVRSDEITRRAWIVAYSDHDPNEVVSEEPTEFGSACLEPDRTFGAGAVEIVLTKALA